MPTIPADVLSVAQLARLRIDETALDDVTDRFSRTLELVAQLEEVDTEGVTPMSNPHDMHQRLGRHGYRKQPAGGSSKDCACRCRWVFPGP